MDSFLDYLLDKQLLLEDYNLSNDSSKKAIYKKTLESIDMIKFEQEFPIILEDYIMIPFKIANYNLNFFKL